MTVKKTLNKDKEFIKKLKQAMLESGFNQVSLAKHLGIKSGSVSKWIRGENNPKLSTLEAIAEITGKPINYFFADDSTTQNIIGNNNTQTSDKTEKDLKKELELLKAKQEVQALTIENLKLRLERLERKK
ncbi:MAG: helix-turn-helix transcriptional regulator [Elusimicrobia bacterium]|nr:helix-turn-helix transcriptional regulator [Elusimicrobiota bacterium]